MDAGIRSRSGVTVSVPAEHSADVPAAPPLMPQGAGSSSARLSTRRALNVWVWEGNFATVQMTLTTGAFQTGFALLLGCSPFVIGLLAALPAFAGLMQLYAASLTAPLGGRRRVVAGASFLSRLLWLPILLIPFVLPPALWVGTFLALTFLSGVLINISNPLWMAWITELVPPESRGRYFGRKNMIGGVVGMTTSIIGGAFLDAAQKHGARFGAFAIVFAAATVFALGSFLLVKKAADTEGASAVPKTTDEAAHKVPLRLPKIDLAPLQDRNYRRIIWFAVCVAVSQGIAGQFFTVYQIQTLALSYTAQQMLGAVSSVASLLSMPLWGYLGDKYGSRPMLFLGCILTLAAPYLWLFTVNDGIAGFWTVRHGIVQISWTKLDIALLNLFSGVGWAGVGLAQFNLMIGAAPAEKRPAYVSSLSAACGVAGGVAPLIGGAIVGALAGVSFPEHGLLRSPYHVVFLVSGLVRLLFFPLLSGIEETGSRTAGYVLGQLKASKPLGSAAGIRTLARGSSAGKRERAARQLARLKTPVAVEELVTALDDVSLPVRGAAAQALGEIGDARALAPLLRKLTDPASGIDVPAALALGKIGDGAAFASLAAMAQLGPPSRQLAAIQALGELRDPRAADVLMSLARDPAVRLPALRALGERDDPATAPFLTVQVSGETDAATLAILADALGRVGNADAISPLLTAWDNIHSPTVRRGILNAVGSLLGGRDAFYPFLTLDAAARDDAMSQTLFGLLRRFRAKAGRDTRAPRAAVRARQALEQYALGDAHGCARALSQLGTLLVAGTDSKTRHEASEALSLLSERAASDPDVLLLAVFVTRRLADGE